VRRPDNSEKIIADFDLLIGADGAHSNVRGSLLKYPGIQFSQKYLQHGYIELLIPADEKNNHVMPVNYFHIWPRGEFCVVASANLDGKFTATLFGPFTIFETFTNAENVCKFFKKQFPDIFKYMGEKNVVEQCLNVVPSSLVSIKMSPHYFGEDCILLGDAAHAMVPFYGQGMNCGFEDCDIFNNMLEKHKDNIPNALKEYNDLRVVDAQAICDLAIYNYNELRTDNHQTALKMRKKLDFLLNKIFPNWMPLYSMVTFSRMRYHQALKNRKWQDATLDRCKKGAVAATLATIVFYAIRVAQHQGWLFNAITWMSERLRA